MADVTEVKLGMERTDDGRFISYGAIVDGVFHPFAGERAGDHDERQRDGEQAQAEAQQAAKGSK